jgi:hypothetical protein
MLAQATGVAVEKGVTVEKKNRANEEESLQSHGKDNKYRDICIKRSEIYSICRNFAPRRVFRLFKCFVIQETAAEELLFLR